MGSNDYALAIGDTLTNNGGIFLKNVTHTGLTTFIVGDYNYASINSALGSWVRFDSTNGLRINTSNFRLTNGNVTASNVDLSGKITATSGEFSGDIIATHINTDSGSIGGWKIKPTKIISTQGDGKTSGITIDSTDGITGHGDVSTHELQTHDGMFLFTEDTISVPGGSGGATYNTDTFVLENVGNAETIGPGGTE